MAESVTAISFAYDNHELAEAYDRLSDLQLESGQELVRNVDIWDGARVLDVGCGTGRLAAWLARTIVGPGEVIGIDPLPERIALAEAHVPDASFRVGQAEDLGAFADESLDAVLMSSVFHWIADKPKALAEVARVLRIGGKLGITTVSRELSSAGSLGRVVSSVLERPPYAGQVERADMSVARPDLTTTDMISMVLASGLELDTLRIVPRDWRRKSGEELAVFLESSTFGNFLRSVPEELRGSLRAELAEAFEAERGPDGLVLRDWMTLLVARRPPAHPTKH